MTTSYKIAGFFGDEMVILESRQFGQQQWSKATLRKLNDCARCQRTLKPGEAAFRPITNRGNRWHRMCPSCMLALHHQFTSQAGT